MKKILLLGSGELGKEFVIAAKRAGPFHHRYCRGLRRELRGAYQGGLPGSGRADNLRAKGDRKAVPDRAQFHETVCGGYESAGA